MADDEDEDKETEEDESPSFEKFTVGIKELLYNPVPKWVNIGSMIKLTSPYCFDPLFFLMKFPEFAKEYAVILVLVNLILGPLSSFIAATISDKYSNAKNSMVNS